MTTNKNEIKDAAGKAYYTCFKTLKSISTSLLIGDSVILIIGFISHTLFLALSVIVAINVAISILMFWFSIYGIKLLKRGEEGCKEARD